MRLNPKFILVISIVCGVIAFYLTLQTLRVAQKGKAPLMAITAINDLDIGATIREEDVKLLVAPADTDPSTIFQNPREIVGKTLRNATKRGSVIRVFDLIKEGDNLSSIIPEGYRAYSLSLPLSAEALQFLKFGSRVDIVFTANNPLQANTVETKTIMKNILVLKITQPEAGKPSQGPVSVTLAIKPVGTEILAFAQKRGVIDLNIRPVSDKNTQDEYINLDELAGIRKSAITAEKKAPEVEVIRGVAKEKVVFA